ncbi:MAG: hypothetical protein AAGA65_30015, partial [Actinomycetota bacterium]
MVTAVDVDSRVADRLPETVKAWPEHDEALGFVSRDAVDFAAAWFTDRPLQVRRRILSTDTEFDPTLSDGEGHWVDTYGSESKCRTESAPLDYRVVITPGTVGLRVTDPRDSSDPYFEDIEIDEEGNVVERQQPTREPITEFSRKSRTRLIRRCLSIPWGDYVGPGERIHVVTLTAPADHLDVFKDHRDGYRALRAFQDRLRHATGEKARGFWKLEFQRRGAPHWHLILITPRQISGQRFSTWLSQAWYESVGSGAESHLRAGTSVDIEQSLQASDALRLALYFAGYSTRKDK